MIVNPEGSSCMTSQASKIPSISMLFETDDARLYTKDARLYQDILGYARLNNPDFPESKNPHSFTAWELTGWLIDNNEEYKEYYKDLSTRNTPKNVRIASRLERIKGIIDQFVELDLIQRVGNIKAARGDNTTTEYSFDTSGHILAWIVESDAKNRHIADQKIYNIMNYHFNYKESSSLDVFYSRLHKKFKEKGVYGEFVVNRLKDRINSNVPVWRMEELFRSMIFIEESTSNPELYRNLWMESLNELQDASKPLVLQNLKLEVERTMFIDAKHLKKFERLRYELREKYDMLPVERECTICLSTYYEAISIFDYFGINGSAESDNASGNCPDCRY